MKKVFTFISSLLLIFILVACNNQPITPVETYTVTFDSNGGSAVPAQVLEFGEKVVEPANPTRSGYEFVHWYTTTEDMPFNFNFPVSADFTLYAKWNALGEDTTAPVISLNPATNPVTVSMNSNWSLPTVTANDNVDGDLTDQVEYDGSMIQSYLVGNQYVFTIVGEYEVTWSVEDEAGNSATLKLSIIVVESQPSLLDFEYSGFNGYYNALSGATTDNQMITTFAGILRNTLTSYKGYNTSTEYNWVLSTRKGGQYILYDITDYVFEGGWITTGWVTNGTGPNGVNVDREHIWPANNMQIRPENSARRLDKFTSFVINTGSFDDRPSGTERGHYSDLHNMWNAERTANQSLHSDHYFGNTGTTGNPNRNGQLFYPGDEYIGDIARALFYMTLTYPHLTLVNEGDSNAVKGSIYYGYLNVLLEWNKLDPVSPEEVARNNKIHQNQGNRNPFIDFYYDGDFAEIFFSFGDPEVPYTI
ncbi:endonuclease [Acholeplasma equirhinis]|uniref:endonuclease n=1 Tax=Acholeplasma equirhinis TaxID=555393 RepID=UPI00197ACB67|nr:endonuclease [Acholeplasma equirhinis]MBN3490882.1 endonuclease [Acholeplasma equirhinis]